MISVVISSYNGEGTLPALCRSLAEVLPDTAHEWELIVVLDGSTDHSGSLLNPLLDSGIIGQLLVLQQRCGQQQATLCGISAARGDIIVTMDDDFGHPPEALPGLLKIFDTSNPPPDLLFAIPAGVSRGRTRNLGSVTRNMLFRWATACGKECIPSSFRIFKRSCMEPLLGDLSHFCYLSVDLYKGAEIVQTVRPPQLSVSGESSLHPRRKNGSRHSVGALAFSLFSLFLCLALVPEGVRKYFGGRKWNILRRVWGKPVPYVSRNMLIVGGGQGQTGLISRALQHGLQVTVSDRNPSAPGCAMAHHFVLADTFDPEATAKAVENLSIHAVATAGTDQPVRAVAEVAYLKSLPGALSRETAAMVTNKRVMKEAFRRYGLPHLPWMLVDQFVSKEIPESFFPGVIKPVDSQGQRGIFLVRDQRELSESIRDCLAESREASAVLEQFYPSHEITFSGWVHGGRLFPLLLTDRETISAGAHIGISPAHRYPSRHLESRGEEVLSICRSLLRDFQIDSGPLYIQLLVGKEGVMINEAACRIGGAYEELLAPRLTGVDLLEMQLELSLDGVLSSRSVQALERVKQLWPPSGFASVILAFADEGLVAATGGKEQLLAIPGVDGAGYLVKKGASIGGMINSTGRAAWAVITGSSPQEVNRTVHHFYRALEVLDDSGKNLVKDLGKAALHPETEEG